MADSGQDPSLSLARAHQTQEVLSKVGLHSFIHETKLDYRLTDYVVSLQSFRHDKDKILMFPSSVGSLLVSN